MSRTSARHRKAPQPAPARVSPASAARVSPAGVSPARVSAASPARVSSARVGPASAARAARRHRKPSPVASVLQNKPARFAAAAVTGSALAVSVWPAATHWMAETHAAGLEQTDAFGLQATGARHSPAGQPAASTGRAPATQQPAASRGAHASPQPEVVSIGIASRPGRHRKPGQPGPTGQPAPAGPPAPASAGYLNPLRAVSSLVPERVDMGVDFSGSGPVYALGNAVVTNASGDNSGWPGGGWITYQLTDGPDAGLMVYLAEDVTPAVQVGQHVSASTVIGNMYEGGDGIETGWAEQNGLTAESQSPAAGGIGGNGPFPTMIGLNFEELLQSLGVPAAPNSGQAGYGVLPAGYHG